VYRRCARHTQHTLCARYRSRGVACKALGVGSRALDCGKTKRCKTYLEASFALDPKALRAARGAVAQADMVIVVAIFD